jgi:hypothetical protein
MVTFGACVRCGDVERGIGRRRFMLTAIGEHW